MSLVVARSHIPKSVYGIFVSISKRFLPSDSYIDITKKDEIIVGAKELRNRLQAHVGAKRFWLENVETLQKINAVRALHQDELEARSLKNSLQEVIIPIGNNLKEREKYLTFYGTVRFGKLLEDLDTLAGWVGFKYFKGPTARPPFSLVTACVDRINLKDDLICSNEDIKLSGFVSWVGNTSLEITIEIEQFHNNAWKQLADAVFVFVARSLKDGSACVVNKMVPQNDVEREYFEKGVKNREQRKRKSKESLFKISPTSEERHTIHDLFLRTLDPKKSTFQNRVKPENAVWMQDTHLKNLIICHPQSRNLYNKIFGGFLMREAFELSWANACAFLKSRPSLICMDDVVFRKPVEVGSLLYLSSQIVFTTGRYLQTRVHAEVLDPKTGHVDTTNIFQFHFSSQKDFPEVIPMTYAEYMLYLEGQRHCPEHVMSTNE